MRVADIFVHGIYRFPENKRQRSPMNRDYRVLAIEGRRVTIQIRGAFDARDKVTMSLRDFAEMAEKFAPDSPKPRKAK